jgi:TonB family protein
MPNRARITSVLAIVAALSTSVSAVAQTTDEAKPSLVAPKIVTTVEPIYPEAKKASGVTATVVLTLTVDKTGKVVDAIVATSGGDEFDAAALEAAKQLVFDPATKSGAPIVAKIPWTFTFAVAPPAVEAAIEKGALQGTIRTPTDEPLPGASVTIANGMTTIATATTDANGGFAVENLAPGSYVVTIVAPGFAPYSSDEQVEGKSVTEVTYRPTPKTEGVQIVVTGKKPPREVTKHTISGEEARKIPGTNGDALRAVESMPGVARPPGLTGILIVRGSGPYDTAVFVDGTQIPIAYHFGGLKSVVPSEVLDRIDFLPGNFGAEYGRAMGGIVDIGLRSPKKQWSGLVQVDLLDGRFLLEGPITERTRFLVAGRRSWVDAWIGPMLEKAGAGVTAAPVYADGQLVLEHDLSDSTTVRLAAFGSSDRLALVLNAPSEGDPISGFGNTTKFFRVQARVESRLSERTKWVQMVSWGEDLQRFEFGDKFLDIDFRPLDIRSDLRTTVSSGVTLIAGLDVQRTTASVNLLLPPPMSDGDTPTPFFARPANAMSFDASWFRPAGYLIAELSPAKGLKLLPGIRADYASDIGKWDVSPRVLGRYEVIEGTTIKGGVGAYHQPPQPWESVEPYGNGKLQSSRAIHYGLGFEQQLGKELTLSVEGFYKDLRRLVVQSDSATATGSGATFTNGGSGRAYGGELLARWTSERFFGWIAYTLSKSERRDAPGAPLHTFQYDQTHIFTALGSYKIGSGWEIGGRFRYVTGNPYTPYVGGIADLDAGGYGAIPGAPWSARSPAFHSLDLRVEKTWKLGGGSVAAYLDLQNVYNRKNPEGRMYNYNYSKSQPLAGLPLLPVIGLRGEL